jgi:hypothetical protein
MDFKRTTKRIRTRFIAYLALFLSSVTFSSGLLVFLYMKSAAFEYQLVGQVTKHINCVTKNAYD